MDNGYNSDMQEKQQHSRRAHGESEGSENKGSKVKNSKMNYMDLRQKGHKSDWRGYFGKRG